MEIYIFFILWKSIFFSFNGIILIHYFMMPPDSLFHFMIPLRDILRWFYLFNPYNVQHYKDPDERINISSPI